MDTERLIEDIRHNCDISDARGHGMYSMCTMVLKLRNLYKWEHGVEPWDEPEPGDLLDWIEKKETYWQAIAEKSYRQVHADGRTCRPHDIEAVNGALGDSGWYYGAGHGRSLKAVFFLGRKNSSRTVEGCPVLILGKEAARELASPFALVQEGVIVIRLESLRFFLWDHIQELRSSSRSSYRYLLREYGLLNNGTLDQKRFRQGLDSMVARELDLFIYHEIGELLQTDFDSDLLQRLVARFPGSIIEFVCRGIKDILADTHPRGVLSHIVKNRRDATLGMYIGFLGGLREKLFPDMAAAWQRFLATSDWDAVEHARVEGWRKHTAIAAVIRSIGETIGQEPDERIMNSFSESVLVPLGLDPIKPGSR